MNSSFVLTKALKKIIDKAFLPGCAAVIALGMTPAFAQQNDAAQSQAGDQVQTKAQRAYGWQLMTDEERQSHRPKMRSLQTAEDRQQYRQEHRAQMQERATERGVTLPEHRLGVRVAG